MVKRLNSDEFLVSFLVDARGGSLQSQRLPKMKIFVPPDAALSPTRIIFRLIQPEQMANKPVLNECNGFASRIIHCQCSNRRFLKPILIEMPHVASLRNGEREIVVLKKSDETFNWKEHNFSMDDDALKEAFGQYYDSLTSEEDMSSNNVFRIATYDIPNFFCLVSHFRRNKLAIGPEGGVIKASQDERIRVRFPNGALMKKITINLEVQNVNPEVVQRMFGNEGVCVSPIVTVEPKRRKFRDQIAIQIPLPRPDIKDKLDKLHLLFSIYEYETHWEDVTEATEFTVADGVLTHNSKISARVWLIYLPESVTVPVAELADKLYYMHYPTPYQGRFLLYARQPVHPPVGDSSKTAPILPDGDCDIRCLLVTDDSTDKTLECQEGYKLRKVGPQIEVTKDMEYRVDIAGNLVPIKKLDEVHLLRAIPFQENRLSLPIRVRDPYERFCGKVAFVPTYTVELVEKPLPVTTLDLDVSGEVQLSPETPRRAKIRTSGSCHECKDDQIMRSEINLKTVADRIGSDWMKLGRALSLADADIELIRSQNGTDEDRAFAVLELWQKSDDDITGNSLSNALREIGRNDVIRACLKHIEPVNDQQEVEKAKQILDKSSSNDVDEEDRTVKNLLNVNVVLPDVRANESTIVEPRDDISQLQMQETAKNLSDVSNRSPVDRKSESSLSYDDEVLEPTLDQIIDPTKMTTTDPNDEINSDQKIDAYVKLAEQFEDLLPDPIFSDPSYEDSQEISEVHNVEMVSCNPNSVVREEGRPELDFDGQEVPPDDAQMMSCVPDFLDLNIEEQLQSLPAFDDNQENMKTTDYNNAEGDYDHPQTTTTTTVTEEVDVADVIEPRADLTLESCMPATVDLELEDDMEAITPVEVKTVSAEPVMDLRTQPGQPVLHEVYEGEPEVEQEIEEFEEQMPDGTVVHKRLVRTKSKETKVIKTTRELNPEETETVNQEIEGRLSGDEQADSNDPNVVVDVYEEELEDGTKVRRQVSTTVTSETRTLREMVADDDLVDDNADIAAVDTAAAAAAAAEGDDIADVVEETKEEQTGANKGGNSGNKKKRKKKNKK